MTKITVRIEAIDGHKERRAFATIEKARAFALKRLGETFDIGHGYAVSADGVVRVLCDGCTLCELFAPQADTGFDEQDEAYIDGQIRLARARRAMMRYPNVKEYAERYTRELEYFDAVYGRADHGALCERLGAEIDARMAAQEEAAHEAACYPYI